jgi:hypothetical protein
MLHMVVVSHSPESCPGRPGNEGIHLCLNTMQNLMMERGIGIVGRWADPPAHITYMVLEAANAHAIQEVMMESGIFGHTRTEIRPILSME